jgi:hypothetical protein
MWRMLLDFFKAEDLKDKEKQSELREAAYHQYRHHRSGKMQYTQEHGEHYDFEGKEPGKEGIVTALQAYHDYWNNSEFKETPLQWALLDGKWKVGVGGAESRAPLHVLQECCREDGLNFGIPIPATRFKEKDLPRTVNFYNWLECRMMSFWEALTLGLGSSFGIYRGWGVFAGTLVGPADADLEANRSLGKVRIEEYNALEPELKLEIARSQTQTFHFNLDSQALVPDIVPIPTRRAGPA